MQCLQVCRLFQVLFAPYLYRELTVTPDSSATGQTPERTADDAFLDDATQFIFVMETRWRSNLRHVRSVKSSSHTLSVLRHLASTCEVDTKQQEASQDIPSPTASSDSAAVFAVPDDQRLMRLLRLDLRCGDIKSERVALNTLFPSEHLGVELLVPRLLRLPSCYLFLTELCLPISFLYLRDSSDRIDRSAPHEDKISCQEFLGLVDAGSGGLKTLRTLLLYGQPLDDEESRNALLLINELLTKVKTLEKFKCWAELHCYQEDMKQLKAKWIFSTESRLRQLVVRLSGSASEVFLSLFLQNHGASLERLGCMIGGLGQESILKYCPNLRHLSLEKAHWHTAVEQLVLGPLRGWVPAGEHKWGAGSYAYIRDC